jgi:hypothetical protein
MHPDHDIFPNCHVVKDLNILEGPGNAQIGNLKGLFPRECFALKKDLTVSRRIYACDKVNGGCFAGPVGADDGEDLAFINLKGQSVNGL